MMSRGLVRLALCALLMGGMAGGCSPEGGGIASAGSLDHRYVRDAERALARRDPAAAIPLAEAAVQAAPLRADHRFVLGRAYLAAGRFASARTAFADVVVLEPAYGRAALNLALAQIACGDGEGARETLAQHGQTIAAADHGLALALAGEPASAVRLLMDAARAPGADARVRQNLALSLGLSGQWQMARAVAAVDLSPADLDARMLDWIAFAQPRDPAAQVAALIGVAPAGQDLGQPTALALHAPQADAVASARPLGTVLAAQEVPVAQVSPIVFGPRQEVVQPLPAARTVVAVGPIRKRRS